MMQPKLKVLDLFSGIGGFSLGLERTGGFETIGFCEINHFANQVLEARWPKVPNEKRGIIALNALLKRALRSSPRGSPVRTSPWRGEAPDLPEPVQDSSGRFYEPFAWFDRASRSWKTWQRCLVEGWETFSGTWPRSGMTRNGIAFRRAPLASITKGTGSGSPLPTPEASNTKAIARRSAGRSPRDFLAPLPTPRPCSGKRSSGANRTEIARGLQQWPTPTARDWKDGSAEACANVPTNGLLGRAVHWPTPRATDGTHGGRVTERKGREGGNLVEAVSARSLWATPTRCGNYNRAGASANAGDGLATQAGGALNPDWVEWLMGYPIGWTAPATKSNFTSLPQVTEPSIPRVAVDVPQRVGRLSGLGNAVVPDIPELIGRAILQARASA